MQAVSRVNRKDGQDLAYWSDQDVNVRQVSASHVGTYRYRYGMLRRVRRSIEKLKDFHSCYRGAKFFHDRRVQRALRNVSSILNGNIEYRNAFGKMELDEDAQDEFLKVRYVLGSSNQSSPALRNVMDALQNCDGYQKRRLPLFLQRLEKQTSPLVNSEITRTLLGVSDFEFRPVAIKLWLEKAAEVWRECREVSRLMDDSSRYADQIAQQFRSWYESNRRSRTTAEVQCELSMAMRKGYYILFETLTFRDEEYVEFFKKDGNGATKWDAYCKRWKRLVASKEEPLGYHSYICVVERGGKRGRLHLHVVRVLEKIPSWFKDPNVRSKGTKVAIEGVAKRMWPLSNPERSTWQPCRYADDAWSKAGWKWPHDKKGKPLPYSAGKISNYLTKYLTKQEDFAINAHNEALEKRILEDKGFISWRIRKSQNFGKKEVIAELETWTSRDLAAVLEARYAPERKHLSLYRQMSIRVLRNRVWKKLSESANVEQTSSKRSINLSLLEQFLVMPGQENLFAEVMRLWTLETLPYRKASAGAYVLTSAAEDVFRVEKRMNLFYESMMRPFREESVGGKD